MAGALPKHSYSRREARRLLKITGRQLKSWEDQNLIPVLDSYGFADLLALRTLAKLRNDRVPVKKIRRAVEALRTKLAEVENPLVELKIFSEGNDVRVQIGRQTMVPTSGQLLLDFDKTDLEKLVSLPTGEAKQNAEGKNKPDLAAAEHLFQQALELEQQGAILEAIDVYKRVVEVDPSFAGALVNLGTIYFGAHDLETAQRYYRQAVEADPDYALAHFNLGNLYDEMGNRTGALSEYQEALRLHPNYADAHYNIALLYQATGQLLRAVSHWKTYLKLDPTSPWAAIARRELDKLYRETVVESDHNIR